MAVRIGDTLGRIGDIGDYPLVKSEDASYSNADKTEATNVKDALDELYDVNKKEHLKEFDPNGFLQLNSGAQLNDVNGIKIENNEIAKYIGLALYGEVIYDENGEIVDDTIEWENGKDFNPNKITLHRGEKYRINYYYINDTQRIIIRPSDNNNIVSVQSDWNETDVNSLAYIKNKPTIQVSNDDKNYIQIIDENSIKLTEFLNGGDYAYSIDLPINTIFFYNGSDTSYIYTSNGSVAATLFKGCFYITQQLDESDKYGNKIMSAKPINVEYQTNGFDKLSKISVTGSSTNLNIDYTLDTYIYKYNGDSTNPVLNIDYPGLKDTEKYDKSFVGKNIKLFYYNMHEEDSNGLVFSLKLNSSTSTAYIVGDTNDFVIESKGFIFLDIYVLEDCVLVNPINQIKAL